MEQKIRYLQVIEKNLYQKMSRSIAMANGKALIETDKN